jgi:hypothetical protein
MRTVLWLLVLLVPSGVSAWADASVRSVHARVAVAPDGTARVDLTIFVRVDGGWLEGFEVAGLDPDLALAPDAPAYATDEAGERWTPDVDVLTGGRVQLAFRGRSPRRGRLTIGLSYQTTLAHRATEPAGEHVRVRWTLPGWRSGLDGVQVEIIAPPGAIFGPRDETDSGASLATTREERQSDVLLRWRRAHLPRTVPWTVAIDVPMAAMSPELRSAPVAALPPPPRSSAAPVVRSDPGPFWLALAVALALVALAKLFAVRRLALRSRTEVRGLVPGPLAVRAAFVIVLAPIAALSGTAQPELALGALAAIAVAATFRPADPPRVPHLGAWRALDTRWLRAIRRGKWLRWITPWSIVDATTPLGALHAALWLSVPVLLADVPIAILACAAVLPIPILLSGTRLAFPSSPSDTASAILARCRALRSLPFGVGLRPVAYVDVRGEVADVRVRTILDRRPMGLLRLDLALAEAERTGGYERALSLIAVTRADSPAEKALADRLPELDAQPSSGGRRIARIASLEMLPKIAEALADCPEAPVNTRGFSTPQETVRDLPAPRAVGL